MDPSMDDPMSEEEEDEELPVDSGSTGKGVVVEGVEIAEEDVYAYGDPDDPLDRVLDVYLADELEDHLYLLQYPMRPADRPSSTPLAVKVKAANHLLEVEHAIKQGGKHFDKNAPAQLRQATQKHTGSRVRPATNFAFGVIRGDEFHLTPVHATMQMRPCFRHIDEAKALEVEMDLDDPDNGGAKATAERPQQVSFKKKESERATAARKSTYAYKKSIEDAEPWVPLEVHGQNDERSLDEFSRMFVEHEDGVARRGTTAKEFPPCERYLQGLDYMEEYDENGESFSAGGRGRSLDDSIDLVTAGTSTYSPVKIPSAPVQQLGGDAKIVGYLKLAHLVPFTVLLDVTKMSPEAVMQALSAEGRQRGLLLRGNWAARAADVWARGPPHAANCLSVAQCLLHKYGAVSRPDLQRRFPELDPVTLKEVLSHIAELDTVNRRWVPKLNDGVTFGMEHPDIVELEEERWTLQESSLKETLGQDVLAPPSCPTFEPYIKALAAAVTAAATAASAEAASAAAAAAGSRAFATRALPSFGVLRHGGDAQERPAAKAAAAGGADSDPDDTKPRAGGGAASKGKTKAEPAPSAPAAAAGAAGGGAALSFAPKRHFKPKPKKRSAKITPTPAAVAQKETAVKQEHDGVGIGGGGESGVEESKGTAVAALDGEGGGGKAGEGGSRGRRGTGRARTTAAAVAAAVAGGSSGGGDDGGAAGATKRRGAARGTVEGSALPTAKEEPRETSGGDAAYEGTDDKDAVPVEDGPMDEDGGKGADTTADTAAGRGRELRASKKPAGGGGKATDGGSSGSGGGSGSKTKEEPVVRPKFKPQSTRAKPKGK
eukprot:g19922.t1